MKITAARTLTLLTLMLCAALAYLWLDRQGHWRNISWATPAAIPPELKAPAQLLPGSGPASVSYASIQERPLFAPDRRPPPPPPPPAPPAPPDPFASIQIQGIFSGVNAGILARVDGKVRRIKINETVGAWTLKSIEGRNVTFTQGDQTRQLPLAYARLNTVTAAPATAANKQGAQQAPPQGAAPDPKAYYREQLRLRNELNASRGLPIQTE